MPKNQKFDEFVFVKKRKIRVIITLHGKNRYFGALVQEPKFQKFDKFIFGEK